MINEYIVRLISETLQSYVTDSVGNNFLLLALSILVTILYIALLLLTAHFLRKLNKFIFSRIRGKKGRKSHFFFLEWAINVYIIVTAIIIPLAGDSMKKSILGSAAVITAVVGFAGQDVIKDVLAGLLISIYKPFEIGDRIELEDGTVGIVESITLRHVVIIRIDTLRVVIPNSKISDVSLINYSFGYVDRSILCKFPVSYDSDVEQVKKIIWETVKESPYSEPGKRDKDGKMVYPPVYFLELADSALIMSVTVYYKPSTPTEVIKDDINSRIFEALRKAGIEIPYAYTNVVVKDS